jgi:hypothetical protein
MFYNIFVEMFEFVKFVHHLITYFDILVLMVLDIEYIEKHHDI